MSYNEALRVAIANELCRQQPRGETAVHPNDIEDIRVCWDDGDHTRDDGERHSPRFQVEVSLSGSRYPRQISSERMLTAMLRAVLMIGDQ